MLYENDVIDAVVAHLRAEGWTIESTALATQHGDDIVASRGGERLEVEAKGEGSSKAHTKRFGSPFTRQQASVHIAVAVLRALRVVSEGTSVAAIALPEVSPICARSDVLPWHYRVPVFGSIGCRPRAK